MIVTFFGHSDFSKAHEYEQTVLRVFEERIGDASAELYFDGYGAFDAFAYHCGKIYQKTHRNVSLIFVTPYMTESYQKTHLFYQKARYDAIIYPTLENVPLKFAISKRNRWMVECADLVITYITHSYGGAYQAYKFAKARQKELLNLSKINL